MLIRSEFDRCKMSDVGMDLFACICVLLSFIIKVIKRCDYTMGTII